MTILVNNLVIGYDKVGSGKKVMVLLHGWGTNRSSLATLASNFAKSYTIYLFDVPGFGGSERPHEVWGLGEYASWLRDCLDKLAIHVDVLVGHSNGGAIAIKVVSGGLVVPQKLILLGASGVRNRENGKKFFFKAVSKSGKVATSILPKNTKLRIQKKWYGAIGSELFDSPGMEEFFKKVTSEDLLLDASMISIPTLLLYGAEDEATPPLYGRLYNEAISGSELHIIEGAGHYVFLDQTTITVKAINNFLGL